MSPLFMKPLIDSGSPYLTYININILVEDLASLSGKIGILYACYSKDSKKC